MSDQLPATCQLRLPYLPVESKAGDQHEDREGPRHRGAELHAIAGRRGDRKETFAYGPRVIWEPRNYWVANLCR
jgi:hypothetical protein